MVSSYKTPLYFLQALLLSAVLAGCAKPVVPTVSLATTETPLEKALRTGDASYVGNENEFIDDALNTIESHKNRYSEAKRLLFNLAGDGTAKGDGSSLTAISWNPTWDAALLTSTYGINESILITNSVFDVAYTARPETLGIIGDTGKSRYMVLGGNPMRNIYKDVNSVNAQMHEFLKNSFSWLTNRNDLATAGLNVVIAQMDDSYYFYDDRGIRAWLDQKYPGKVSYNAKDVCDGTNLAGCITGTTQLLIISQFMSGGQTSADAAAVHTAVKNAMDNGIPVLYMHYNGSENNELSTALFSLLNVSYDEDNYWERLQLANFDIRTYYGAVPADIASIKDLLTDLKNNTFTMDLNACTNNSCSDSGYVAEFRSAAEIVQALFASFDRQKLNIFSSSHYRFHKDLILLADKIRQKVVFPMDKVATAKLAFLKAQYADYAVYNYRTVNAAQLNMGNFSRSDFSHITPVSKTINLTSKPNFRSAGIYALPGKTFTITRLDNNAVNTTVFLNTQRSSATHEFDSNGYTRPKFLQSTAITIKPQETLTLTSAYGGTVQIGFDANEVATQFRFTQVGTHPYWNGQEDNDAFEAALANGDYDWAELVTPGFEVHSTLTKMRDSIANPSWNSATNVAAATERYIQNYPHVLAGFQGPGIDVVSEIHNFATSRHLQIATIDMVKHMNADQAACGSGCSGNPYDAYWAFNPIGHGDIHELGHGLEKSRFRFSGWDGHASTNPYSYYSKSQYFKLTGIDPACQSLPFQALFNTLQASAKQADPFAYMQAANLTDWSEGVAIYIQMMMSAQAEGVLVDGWHLLPRLHILEREFKRATVDDASWEAMKSDIGFASFTRSQANALSSNDWLVIAISYALGRDVRDYLTMWGLSFSAPASSQVAAFSYPVLPRKFYVSGPNDFCKGLNKPSLPVDGNQVWPL